ncbi:hypothetical protein L0152_03875, partial [bacterium]|nr:hypothetical protein [bacterium]
DRKAAKHEIELAESLSGEVQMAAEFPGILENLKHWIERKPEPPSINSSDLISKYSASGLFGSYTLILKEGNKYDFTARGDVINFCPIQPKQGEYLIQGRYLILIPGPHFSEYGLTAPEVMVPVIWDNRVFLLWDTTSTEGILEFCNIVNSRKDSLKSLELWSYHKTRDPMQIDDELKGNPSLPEEWNDCILDEPMKPEVIKVEERSVLVVNMGKDDGLRVGMKLYLDNSALLAVWKINEVSAKQSHAIPFGDTPEITLGEKLSTRIPD